MNDLTTLANNLWSEQRERLEPLLNAEADQGSSDLIASVRHQIFSGGKRLRAMLPYGTHRTIQGEHSGTGAAIHQEALHDPEVAQSLWLGLCLELLHSGTLAHDDVMDGDKLRRNQPTVWVQFGTPQAINAGDLLFYLAQETLHRADLTADYELNAVQWMARAMRHVIHGQAIEIHLRRDKILPDLETYRKVVVGKTGGLFGLGLVFGAICSKIQGPRLEDLFSLGLDLGALFQIQDDLIDLLGAKGREEQGSDLLEGKPSWLIAHCCSQLCDADQQRLKEALYRPRSNTNQDDIALIMELFDSTRTTERGVQELQRTREQILITCPERNPEMHAWVEKMADHFLSPLAQSMSHR